MDALDGAGFDASEVGSFRQGSANSQWALGRYLVGRSVAEALSRSLLIVALAVFGVAGLVEWAGSTFWMVVIGIVGIGVLIMRSMLLAVLRRLPLTTGSPETEHRLGELVADTRRDVLRELRRIGLPGRTWTLPLLATRLIGKRREETTQALRRFEVDRVVPPARLDEVHLLLQSSAQHPMR